jgi:hypothetical protein
MNLSEEQNENTFKTDLITFLKLNKEIVFCEEELNDLLSTAENDFCLIFYYLSISNRVLSEKTFRNSYLRSNLNNLSEKDLYFLYGGIRNQLKLKFYDFFYLFHHFAIHTDKRPFQSLLLSLFNENDYKLNEIIISNNLLIKILELNNLENPSIFQLKFLKCILEMKSLIITKYLKSLNLKLEFNGLIGCKSYFMKWYLSWAEDQKEDLIEIKFR